MNNFNHNYPESHKRRLIVYFTTLLILLTTIHRSWDLNLFGSSGSSETEQTNLQESKKTDFRSSLEEKAFLQEAKIAVSAYFFFEHGSLFKDAKVDPTLKKQALNNFESNTKKEVESDLEHLSDMSIKNLMDRAILGKHLGLEIKPFLEELKNRPENDVNQNALNLLSEDSQPLSPDQKTKLAEEYSWLGELLLFETESDPKLKKEYIEKFEKETIPKLYGALFAFLIFCLAIFSFLACLIYQFTKGFRSNISLPNEPSTYLLETFTLYLILMLAGGYFLEKLILNNIIPKSLYLQVAVVVIALFAILYPAIYKIRFKDTCKSIGLKIGSLKDLFIDIIRTPFLYLAAIIPILFLLVIYSQILLFLDIDISQGTHPIVPIIAESKDYSKIFLIFFLAVVCAPIIEEIMFRGALYTWIRSKMNIFLAVLISSFIFAIVHPQGPIGIFPLTIIGSFLALLREWRGNLIAPMIAHACVNCVTLVFVLLLFS